MIMKESRRLHWDAYWSSKEKISEVYSNSDRVVRNLSTVIDLKGKKVLEVGAGSGRDSFPIIERGASVTQLDYSIPSLKIMQSIARDAGVQVNIVGGDTFMLPFKDETFDVVFHQGLLEHFRADQAVQLLRENARVVKRGGLLLVDVPQRYHIYTVIKHILITFNAWFAGWEREFSVRELRGIVSGLAFEPVLIYGEWMYPSLLYRTIREALLRTGIKLPLTPGPFGPLTIFRKKIRESLRDTSIAINTSLSFGIIARKK